MSSVYILWLREIKKYFRARSRIIGALGQPLLFLLAFGYGFGSIFQQAGQGNYLDFLGPGIILMSILFTGIFSGIGLIWDRQFGFLKETMVAPVPRWQIMLGKTLGGATVATFQGLIVFVLILLIGFRPYNPALVPLAFVFWILTAILFTSLGVAIASTITDMQGFQLIINFLVQPMFFFSGALFPLQGLPVVLVILTRINPLTYAVDGTRGILINVSEFGVNIDLIITFSVAAIFLTIGSLLFKRIET